MKKSLFILLLFNFLIAKSQESINKTEQITCSSYVDYIPFPMYVKQKGKELIYYLGRIDFYFLKCEKDIYIEATYNESEFKIAYNDDPSIQELKDKYVSKKSREEFIESATKFSLEDGITEDIIKDFIRKSILAKNKLVSIKLINDLLASRNSIIDNPYDLNISILNKSLTESKKSENGKDKATIDKMSSKLIALEFLNLISKIKLLAIDVHPYQPSFISLAGYTDFFGYVKDNANGTSQLEFSGSFRLRKNYSKKHIWFYNFYPYFNTTLLDSKNRTLYLNKDTITNEAKKDTVYFAHVLDFIQHNVVLTGGKQNIYFYNNKESSAGFQFYFDLGFNLYITKLAKIEGTDTSEFNSNAFNFYASIKARCTPQNLGRKLTAAISIDCIPYTFLFDHGYSLNYGDKLQDGTSMYIQNNKITSKNFVYRGQFDLQFAPKKGPKYFFRSSIYSQDMSIRSGNSFVQIMLGISKTIDLSSFGNGK